jgi:hypothetical protein
MAEPGAVEKILGAPAARRIGASLERALERQRESVDAIAPRDRANTEACEPTRSLDGYMRPASASGRRRTRCRSTAEACVSITPSFERG